MNHVLALTPLSAFTGAPVTPPAAAAVMLSGGAYALVARVQRRRP